MSTASDSSRDPMDLLVEQFLAQRRSDSKITVAGFAATHPEHAAQLLDLLPTIVALEEHKKERAGSGSGRARAAVPQLERLGEFKIVREVGRGGMGVVFEAVQESLGRKVALKVLPQAALMTSNQLERFRREAQIAAQLHHSNIVPVFGSGESDGYHWYAMQFIAGVGLDRWRDEQQAAPPTGSGAWRNRARFLARLAFQAADALHYAHGLGTLHRDIKPGNLLLDASDHVWVTDFGLAKALEAEGLTNTGDLLGTLQYMAPEQFSGQYDVRSEVYALGVTLYELLTLRAAFAGSSRSELMERIRTQSPEPLRRLCPDAPEDLIVVIEKAIAREPADRYADAGEFASDLQAFLEDRPVMARRLSTTGVVLRWCRRNRGMASLAASTLLAVLGAGIAGWVFYGVADDALGRAAQQSAQREKMLQGTLDAFGGIFDTLIGPDPALAFDEDEETGEQTVVVRSVAAKDVAVLDKMLAFYSQFAAENADNQSVQLETARAYRRVGAIHARLGTQQNLEQADKAFREAIDRLAAIKDRDTRRERASALVELSKVLRTRQPPGDSNASLQQALALLEALPAAGKNARIERANVHYLLAKQPPARRPGAGNRPTPADAERDRARVREQLERAMEVIDGVLAEDSEHVEARALKARCLLAGRQVRRREDRAPAQAEAIVILRDLATKHPNRSADVFELSRVLLEPVRAEDRGGPPREVVLPDVAACREAAKYATQLLAEQPQMTDYQRLRAQAGAELGRALVDQARTADPAARPALLLEAEKELRLATRGDAEPARGPRGPDRQGPDRRGLAPWLARRTLIDVYDLGGSRDEAIRELGALLDQLEPMFAAGGNPGRFGDLFGRPGAGEPAWREQMRTLVQRLGDPALQERWRAFVQRLPAREETPPGPDPRRGR